jgi:CO/xanthine dehydrogenase Mo-binding subunit
LRGTGRLYGGRAAAGTNYACFVRSQHACADIKAIDVKPALAIKGVIAVLHRGRHQGGQCRQFVGSIRRWQAAAAPS